MANLREKLIKLGYKSPELRDNLRSILDKVAASDPPRELMSQMDRKPKSWDYIRSLDSEVFHDHASYITSLPFFEVEELYSSKRPDPLDFFEKESVPQVFILNNYDGHLYLVDTQDYDYARYIVHIDGHEADYIA